MKCVNARLEEYRGDLQYRIYVADSLNGILTGKGFAKRYSDIVIEKPEDTRTADEIAEEVINMIGLRR